LEDRIDALLTKDSNKIKVYTDGYDGHSLRAYYYFKEAMSDIDPNSVDSINSIQTKYKKYRQLSKAPTFALTYAGTYHTLMKNCGFSEEEAKSIEANYHELYKESDAYKATRLKEVAKQGYAEVAFGLKVRTPIMHQIIWGNKHMPYEAMAEARSVGNAFGQSYGLLNNRACNAFLEAVWASDYARDILPVAQIHDASYWLVRASTDVLEFFNTNLVKEYQWCELPEIKHSQVGLFGEVEIFYPNWATPIPLSAKASKEEIEDILWSIELCKSTQ
jgi:DNA polymerase I